ncbi:hypothetical protein K5R88_09385 [Pseudomonas sp. MM213]|uniref:hypothetical protein n=1 Tax=unclassified Pseudomonas TaxID=196821 RepID=UPI001CE0FE21|nr:MULTISPECIES: hypothetical protein [unclassified Pseudomonas]UCP11805.1 hypothetical protein K5R88_09385 [Pseudomonas sp. MM213]
MESNVAFQTSATMGSIASAFPPPLKLQTDGVGLVMGNTSFATHQGIEVKVGEDHLVIPYRIHHEGNELSGKALNGTQSIMYSCLLTRHHDGHVRQRQLERVLPVSEPWVVPFVFQLTGEYVIEILDACEAQFRMLDPMLYGTFIRDNPKYFQATRDRMISYWDCYYRWLYQRRSDYVGFRLFDRFQEFASRL